jgi:23S rRNA (uracil1939-C5)-methyltransferase
MDDTPVTTGDTYVVAIEELGSEGDGVGYVDDFAVLVAEATLGDTVRMEITEVDDTFARGEIIDAEFEVG